MSERQATERTCALNWHEPNTKHAERYKAKCIAALCQWCGCWCVPDKSLGTWRKVE